MTREEAAKNPVDLAIWEFENAIKGTEEDNSEYPNYCIHIDEYKTALKALLWMKGPQPDPDTGLVPCGCGGKAKYINSYYDDVWMYENYVGCPDCYASSAHISTSKHGYSKAMEAEIKLKLKDNWNTAMGWREKE